MNNTDELDLMAYVDGELSADQQAEFLATLRDNPELARAACELSELKARVKLAYADLPSARQRQVEGARAWRTFAAGVALFAFGLLSGWLLPHGTPLVSDGQRVATTAPEPVTRIVFQLTDADPDVAGALLDDIETMLSTYRSEKRLIRIELVGNNDGLSLYREGLSPHRERIRRFAARFDNLTFFACKNTIDRLYREQGITVKLIPDAEVTASGVAHVAKRQHQGWSYIRV